MCGHELDLQTRLMDLAAKACAFCQMTRGKRAPETLLAVIADDLQAKWRFINGPQCARLFEAAVVRRRNQV